MSVTQFTSYDVDQDDRFAALLKRVGEGIKNQKIVMGEAARIIKKFSRANFILKGPGQYPPLSADYFKAKLKKFGPLPILVGGTVFGPGAHGHQGGWLRDSVISGGATKTHPDSILVIGEQSLILGTKTDYAGYLQDGTKKMPARLFLFLTDVMINLIVASAEAHADEVLEDRQ